MPIRDHRWWIILAAIVLSGAAVLTGDIDGSVSGTAALEVWADVIRDVDQLGLEVIRVSDAEEIRIGRDLAASMRTATPGESLWQPYVTAVGDGLAQHVRRQGIPYAFHVIDWDEINAFALPGGQVFVTTGMLEILRSEAELAHVLAHEIAHVDQRHAIEQLHTRIVMERVGLDDIGAVVDLPRMLIRMGYRKYQELEADSAGLRFTTAADYDPRAGVSLFERLTPPDSAATPGRAATPLGESLGAVAGALGSYFDTHPATEQRISRLRQLIAGRTPWLRGKRSYVGVENHRLKVARAASEFPDEFTESP